MIFKIIIIILLIIIIAELEHLSNKQFLILKELEKNESVFEKSKRILEGEKNG